MTRKILLAAFAAASMSAFTVSGEDRLPGKSSFDIDTENLYELFRDPAPQYRPYARWWWNGLRLAVRRGVPSAGAPASDAYSGDPEGGRRQ